MLMRIKMLSADCPDLGSRQPRGSARRSLQPASDLVASRHEDFSSHEALLCHMAFVPNKGGYLLGAANYARKAISEIVLKCKAPTTQLPSDRLGQIRPRHEAQSLRQAALRN